MKDLLEVLKHMIENGEKVEIKGELFGAGFERRNPHENDNHALVSIFVEDDEYWYKKITVSSAWIDDAISVLQKAKNKLESDFVPDEEETYGYRFK